MNFLRYLYSFISIFYTNFIYPIHFHRFTVLTDKRFSRTTTLGNLLVNTCVIVALFLNGFSLSSKEIGLMADDFNIPRQVEFSSLLWLSSYISSSAMNNFRLPSTRTKKHLIQDFPSFSFCLLLLIIHIRRTKQNIKIPLSQTFATQHVARVGCRSKQKQSKEDEDGNEGSKKRSSSEFTRMRLVAPLLTAKKREVNVQRLLQSTNKKK